MQLSDHLDIQALLRRASQNSLRMGIFILFVPVIAAGIGVATVGAADKFPFFLWLIIAVSTIMGAFCLASSFTDIGHPGRAAAFRWPTIGTPEEVIRAVEKDWNTTAVNQKFACSDAYLSRSWLLRFDGLDVSAYPFQALVWAYPKTISRSVNGVPTGTGRHVETHWADGRELSIVVFSDDEASNLLFELQSRAPWAFYGFVKEYFQTWKFKKYALIAAVRQRFEEVQAGQQVSPSENPSEAAPSSGGSRTDR